MSITWDEKRTSEDWVELDSWWESFSKTRNGVFLDSSVRPLDRDRKASTWTELEDWWESYAADQQQGLVELDEILEQLEQRWRECSSRFDGDPLAGNWFENPNAGPLRTNQEENWSQWLAHLIRSSTGGFTQLLFEEDYARAPDSVSREVLYRDATASDRRIDILLDYGMKGISIEVKKGDEHFLKTLHTAELIENQEIGDWTHYLLLPERKKSVLRTDFGDRFDETDDGHDTIAATHSTDIQVLYWEDVGVVLRRTLLENRESDPHWEASAYLFITLIEQKILQFRPSSLIQVRAESDSSVRVPELSLLKSANVQDQIIYLRQVMDEETHE